MTPLSAIGWTPTTAAPCSSEAPPPSSSSSTVESRKSPAPARSSAISSCSDWRTSSKPWRLAGTTSFTLKRCQPNAVCTGSLTEPAERPKTASRAPFSGPSAVKSGSVEVVAPRPARSAATASKPSPAASLCAPSRISASSGALIWVTARRSGRSNSSIRASYSA